MSIFVPISLYIQYGQISGYLAQNEISDLENKNGQSLNPWYARLLNLVTNVIQARNAAIPTDATLNETALYLYALCGKFTAKAQQVINNLVSGLPAITGPTNQSVTVGTTATFSVSVVSGTPVTYQWLLNGVPIAGATGPTYNVLNAQLSQSGGLYSVSVTNSAGTQVSNVATLTVTALLQGSWYAGQTDYSASLLAGTDNVPWSGTFNYTAGQPLVVPFPAGQVAYVAIKYPTTETMKTNYANPVNSVDQGPIAGLVFGKNIFNSLNYIFTHNGNQLGINAQSGQVTFS